MKPVIRVPHQGQGNLGNEFFWYIFGKTYARRHGLELEVNRWMGNALFGTSDPAPGPDPLPCIYEKSEHGVDDTVIPHAPPFADVSFVGYFQYHTSYYAPDREYIRSLFPPRPEIAAPLERGWARLRERGGTAVAIHLRRRDFGFLYHYRTPAQWYLELLERIWPGLDRPYLYVASDDIEAVIGDFARYAPVSAADLAAPLPACDCYRDFHALQHADVVLIPNSTFSFAAAMLNRNLRASYRSVLPARRFVPFDPWDSKPLEQGWEAHVERYPLLLEIWKPMPGWKRWLKWVRFHFRKTMYAVGIFRADGRPPEARRAPLRPIPGPAREFRGYPVFVIHYTPWVERKKLLNQQLQREGLHQNVHWIENFDRETISEWPELELPQNELSRRVIAVNLAHVDALRRISSSAQGYGLVLEDDAVLKPGAQRALERYGAELPSDWDMLFIGAGGNFHIPRWRRRPGKHVYLKGSAQTSWGGDGATRCADSYFVTRRAAALLLTSPALQRPFAKPIDWALNDAIREHQLRVYWLEPTLAAQGSQLGLYGGLPFVGDPSRWIQPADQREFPGDSDLGFGLLERWRKARRLVTASAEARQGQGGPRTRLYVHSTVHPLYESKKAPHAIVDAEDLVIDFSKLHPARTLRFRPGYKTGRGRPYHRYRPGALLGSAAPAGEFAGPPPWAGLFSREHFQDIFGSYRDEPRPAYDEVVDHPVLFITREGNESRNIFHTATDLLNALEAALVVGVSRPDLEVVLLDNAPPAPYDRLWPRIFAPRHGVRRVGDFAGRRVLFRRAIFSPPGYHSLFFAGVLGENPAPHRVGLLDAFAGLVLRAHGIDPVRRAPPPGPLRATLVLRRPYEGHEHMARQLANEEACLALLRSAGLEAQGIDFARHPFEEQIRLAAETDILVGVHGAGLTHLLWMPGHGGLLEIDPAGGRTWRCFRHLATWTGREAAVLSEPERRIRRGTLVTVDPARFEAAVRDLAGRVQARRAASGHAASIGVR